MADPQGFSLAVPQGYQRSTDDQRVIYVSPDGAFRIGIKTTPAASGGPLAVMRASDADGPDTNPGYRGGTVVATTHNGLPAALWEFTWNGFTTAEGARHTFDLCWDENGRMYDVWVSAPVGQARRGPQPLRRRPGLLHPGRLTTGPTPCPRPAAPPGPPPRTGCPG